MKLKKFGTQKEPLATAATEIQGEKQNKKQGNYSKGRATWQDNDYKEIAEYINANARQYLKPAKHGGYICPICGSGSGKHGTGISTKDGVHFTCWGKGQCFTNASMTDILAIKAGVTDTSAANFREVVEAAAREAGIPLNTRKYSLTGTKTSPRRKPPAPNAPKQVGAETDKPIPAEYIKRCRENLCQTDYFAKRGISAETVARFPIGYDAHFPAGGGKTWQAVIFFTGQSSYEARNTDLAADGNNRHRKQGKQQIFNREALKGSEPVFFTESIFDSLSIIEAGGEAVSAGGTSGTNFLLQAIKADDVTTPRLILAMDNDEAGRKATAKAMDMLSEAGYPCEAVSIYGNAKDANEAICANREDLAANVRQAARDAKEHSKNEKAAKLAEYTKSNIHNTMINFDAETENKQDCYSTGFAKMDRLLDGGFYPGLYIIGAISSLGKTTFCLQMADNVAAMGQDVLIFSLEMSKFELIAKSLSRLSYELSVDSDTLDASTTRQILAGKYKHNAGRRAAVRLARQKYDEYNERIYILEGIGNIGAANIREAVKKHIDITGRRPFVFIDYVQILAPASDRLTDKQATDKNVLELKRLSRDFNIPVLTVSSLNRDNYNAPINLAAFKESGAIEYGSDCLLGLQYWGMDSTEVAQIRAETERLRRAGDPIDIQLKVLKNRNGIIGDSIFTFLPRCNFFHEIPTGDQKNYHEEIEKMDNDAKTGKKKAKKRSDTSC